jgi:multiple antibiotic resistance protein
MLENITLAFIPLFVAVDAIGVLPIFVSLTSNLNKREKFTIVAQSVLTAACLAIGFIFLGKAIFNLLNITIGDFMVAGGALLFCISIIDLISPSKRRRIPADELGFVPLGTPLIVGPAVLTTSLLMLDQHGLLATLTAVLINIVLAGGIFLSSNILIKALGVAGTRALSKVTSLLLAAIAVMMIRKGVTILFSL